MQRPFSVWHEVLPDVNCQLRGFDDDVDVVENTPTNIVYYYYGCCTTSGCACAHPREPMLLLLREKKRGKKTGHAQKLLPVRATSGHVTDVTFGQKGPTRVDMAQVPVAHAQNILPDKATSRDFVTSG